jgi:hypothetical protein
VIAHLLWAVYGEVFGNSLVLGTIAEWSFAWPVSGIDADWSVLLTSDFSLDVVAAASLVGPAGVVPTGLTGVVALAVSEIVGTTGADKSSFLHPKSKATAAKVQSTALRVFMVGSCQV